MAGYTINQIDDLFSRIAVAHDQINDYFFTTDIYQVETKMNAKAKYPMLLVILMGGVTPEQVKLRDFQVMVMDIPKKDKSDVVEILSDTEQILDDVIEILKKNSIDYDVIGDPLIFPYDEEHSDWVTGHRAEVQLQTNKVVTECNIPASSFVNPSAPPVVVTIVDQNGNTLATVNGGGQYVVTVLSGINDTLTANVTTIVDNII